MSAFGGIVAVNRPVTAALADALAPVFTEVVVAPGYEPDALDDARRRGRTCGCSAAGAGAAPARRAVDRRRPARAAARPREHRPVGVDRGHRQPATDEQWDDLAFAWVVCAAVSSNAIVFAKDRQAFGIGAGQQNRLDSARIAADRAGDGSTAACAPATPSSRSATASTPRPPQASAAVIQPGGSVRDDEVVAAADEHGIAMVFTGQRHFRH